MTINNKWIRGNRKSNKLSPEEEAGFLDLAREGDRIAVDEILDIYIPAICENAKEYSTNHDLQPDDLISAGCSGVLEAIKYFDATKGYKFSTYAFACAQNSMKKMLLKRAAFKIPKLHRDCNRIIKQAIHQLSTQGIPEPSLLQLVEATGLTAHVITKYSIPYPARVSYDDAIVSAVNDGNESSIYNNFHDDLDISSLDIDDLHAIGLNIDHLEVYAGQATAPKQRLHLLELLRNQTQIAMPPFFYTSNPFSNRKHLLLLTQE